VSARFAAFACAGCLLASRPARAEPESVVGPVSELPVEASGLQNAKSRDTRNSAYSLPQNTWGFDVGALGMGAGDAYAKLGVAYGFGAGLEAQVNLAHSSFGLLNVAGFWQFIDAKNFALAARVAFWYARGEWFWIAQGPAKDLIRGLDAIGLPVLVAASAPLTPWLQLDLDVGYTHAEVFGTIGDEDNLFIDAQLGVRQALIRPGVRFFLTSATELDVSSNLPPYTAAPFESERIEERFRTVPFSETWSAEVGIRSRFAAGLFGTIRLHYGEIARGLYGARLYPSFDVELRI